MAKDTLILGQSLGKELGGAGTWINGGFITHEEYNQKLIWRRGIDIFDKMRRSDGSIQALLKVCKHPLLAATWDVEAASEEEFDQYVMRFCKNELFNRNVIWDRFLHDVLGKLDFGYSIFEKTYELTEFEGKTRIGIENLGWRKQWSILKWETPDGEPGVTQQLVGNVIGIPDAKLLVFTNDREGDNYQGISLLRYVYKDWDIKHRIENLMAIAAERSLGVPIVEKSANISKKDEERMRTVMKNFRANHQQFIEYTMGTTKLDWMKIETNIKADLIPMLEYLQHEIDKSVLAQFLDLGGSRSGGGGGSKALSQDHSQLFEKALEAVAKEIVAEVNTDLIQQICDLNFTDLPNGYPKLTFSNIGDQNLEQMGNYLNRLASVDLVTPDRDLENQLRQWAGLGDLPDDIYDNYEDRITAQTQALPLTQLGPGQTPNQPTPTGQPRKNPSTAPARNKPGSKPSGDQSNTSTRTNQKKDGANKPAPVSNSARTNTRMALEEAIRARNNLVADVLEV
jgi:hypothetical protein